MRLGAAIALGFALLVVRSTVLPMVGLAAIGPDLLFPLVVFYAASGRFNSGTTGLGSSSVSGWRWPWNGRATGGECGGRRRSS